MTDGWDDHKGNRWELWGCRGHGFTIARIHQTGAGLMTSDEWKTLDEAEAKSEVTRRKAEIERLKKLRSFE